MLLIYPFFKSISPDVFDRFHRMIDQIGLVKNLIIPFFSFISSSAGTDLLLLLLLHVYKSISIDGFAIICKHINEVKVADVN